MFYYTNQCPFTAKYVFVVASTAKEHGILLRSVHITTKEQAQSVPSPVAAYALFHDGDYVTNEVLNDKRFLKLIQGKKAYPQMGLRWSSFFLLRDKITLLSDNAVI